MSGRYAGGVALLLLSIAGCDAPTTTVSPKARPSSPAAVVAPAGPERLVLAFGDSLYAGYGLARGESLPDAVQSALRRDGVNATVVNAGVSGDTSAAGRQRLAFALDNLPRKPDLVLLGLGGNDVLRQIAPAETRANMAAMLTELRRREVPVVLTGMLAPPNLGPDYATAINAMWPDLAREYDAGLYPFILDGVIGNPTLMLPDRVHPNKAGVARIAARLTPVVQRALSED